MIEDFKVKVERLYACKPQNKHFDFTGMICPLCGEWHTPIYLVEGVETLVCDKAEPDKLHVYEVKVEGK